MLPPLVADMDIAVPVVHFLRRHGVDVLSAREEGWGALTDSQILAQAHAMERFVLTHDADFDTLAMHRGEPLTGIVYLHPGGRPPAQVMADLQAIICAINVSVTSGTTQPLVPALMLARPPANPGG